MADHSLQYPTATMTLDTREIVYTLRQNTQARHPNLRVAPAQGLVVTVPRRGWTSERVAGFLRQHQRWVLDWVAQLERRWQHLPTRWPYGDRVLYQGQAHAVRIRPGRTGAVEIASDRRLLVSARTPNIEGARRVLGRWIIAQATRTLTDRVEVFSAMMGLCPQRIYVRPLRRAWGRCWPNGTLSFRSALIMAPPEVLDYVVVHELAHLRERNHSTRFWEVVAAYDPDAHFHRTWLRTHGPLLAV